MKNIINDNSLNKVSGGLMIYGIVLELLMDTKKTIIGASFEQLIQDPRYKNLLIELDNAIQAVKQGNEAIVKEKAGEAMRLMFQLKRDYESISALYQNLINNLDNKI